MFGEGRLDGLTVEHAGEDAAGVDGWRYLAFDTTELVFVVVVGLQCGGGGVALVVVVVRQFAGTVLFLVDREVSVRRPPGGVERSPDTLDGLRHGRDVRRDDQGTAAVDDPLDDVAGVGGARREHVEHLPFEVEDGDGSRRPRVDTDQNVVTALRKRAELDAVGADAVDLHADVAGALPGDGNVLRTGLDLEDGLREAAVLLGGVAVVLQAGVVQGRAHLAGPLADGTVDTTGVAVLRPAAAASRAATGHL